MRLAYVILSYLLAPVYAMYWLFRGLAERDYWDRFGQRFGFGYPQLPDGTIWLHAVSVGEVQAAAPLLRQLLKRFPLNYRTDVAFGKDGATFYFSVGEAF